ncbi:FtsK/SpoIIIE domain-containing protein [Embleya sp. NBC_00888]|uniref:FtsK/SpoIIIE domain-containing protein n=1 Tax=Embleya sp. NBC_00888 TaxID=2975960 RepID=UPI00386A1213|nr:FtsK/SpoIIIE domain-containing protein [Embleya sp. NBC_00888]
MDSRADYYAWRLLQIPIVRGSVLVVLGTLLLMLVGVPLLPVFVAVVLVALLVWGARAWLRRRRWDSLVRIHGEHGAGVVQFVSFCWPELMAELHLAVDKGRPGPTGEEVWRSTLSKEEHTRFMVRLAEAEPVVHLPELVSVHPSPVGPVFHFRPVPGVPVTRYLSPETCEELRHHWGVPGVSAHEVAPGLLGWTARISDPLDRIVSVRDWPGSPELFRWNAALGEGGAPVSLPLAHTLCVGGTGSGKGSVLWGVVNHLRPWVGSGLALLYGIDPKRQELRMCSDVFRRVAYQPDEWAALLSDLVKEMQARQDSTGRDFAVSTDRPLVLLAIDEYAALAVLDTDKKRRDQASADRLLLLTQGRSVGMYVFALVQSGLKAYAAERDFFPLRIGLRTASESETDMVLGDGAADRGAGCHLITPATPANGYATAGLGYVVAEESPAPVRVRFPYVPDEVLTQWEWAATAKAPAALGAPK